jgi:glycosyltransferase involved in cell wall biosynthesis
VTPLDVLHVVVPAHDEERLLPECLASIKRAVARVEEAPDAPRLAITVVLDACTDRSAEVVAEHGVEGLAVDVRCVGRARAAGVARAARSAVGLSPDRVWVAMTDADSQVPPTWLTAQIDLAGRGVELMVGRVHPEGDDLPAGVLARWWRLHHTPTHLPIHGANLGFTLGAYRRAGGFPPIAEHEDVAFVRAALAAGCAWTQEGPWVRTSARTVGRVAGGFAGYLRALAATPEKI